MGYGTRFGVDPDWARRGRRAGRRLSLGQFLLCMALLPVLQRLGDLLGRAIEARWYPAGQVVRGVVAVATFVAFMVLCLRYRPE